MTEPPFDPPPGYAWARFAGGSLEGDWRLIHEPIEIGSSYELVATGERWVWRGDAFVLVES